MSGILIDISLIAPENVFLWLDENQYSKLCSLCQFVVELKTGCCWCSMHWENRPVTNISPVPSQSELFSLRLHRYRCLSCCCEHWAVLGRGRFPVKLRRPRPRVFPSLPMPASRPESDTCCCVIRRKTLQPPCCLHLFPLVFKVAPVEPIWGLLGTT